MLIDPFTVLLFGLCLKALFGVLFLAFWLRQDGAAWFGWWSATFLLSCVPNGLYLLHGVTPAFVTVGLANAVLILAFGCCWEAARMFDRRPPRWSLLFLPPVAWLAACLIPGFMENMLYRVVLSSTLLATLIGMTAIEFWRGRSEHLPSRWPVVALFATFALLFASRIPLANVLPAPFGALPMEPGWLGVFNLLMFSHTVVLAVLIVAMSKERLELEQRTNAQTDPLTGALNRRAFMLRGSRLLLRHQMDGAPLCLLFLDLDHFKSFNDRFGHAGGDEVLVRFVKVVQDNNRPTDFLFRIGGEEFCCLLPYTGTAQAQQVAERIRQQFEAATFNIAGETVKATVSAGVASTEALGYDIDALMRHADMAVYAAKRQGRNRVVIAAAGEETKRAESVAPKAGLAAAS